MTTFQNRVIGILNGTDSLTDEEREQVKRDKGFKKNEESVCDEALETVEGEVTH